MKVIWAVLCESSSIDQETNNVSLFNILEEMHFLEPPHQDMTQGNVTVAPFRFILIALFSRSDVNRGERSVARLVIASPGGLDSDTLPEFEVDLESAHRNRTRLNFGGFPLKGEGEYSFQIQTPDQGGDWQVLFELPLQVGYLIGE